MIYLPRSILARFDKDNGLLDCDRDLYLSIVQFLRTKTLRNFIGISEETFNHIDHYFFIVYRLNSEKVPLRKLILPPNFNTTFSKRSAISSGKSIAITLKENIFKSIFEVNLRFVGETITIWQARAYNNWGKDTGPGITIRRGLDETIEYQIGQYYASGFYFNLNSEHTSDYIDITVVVKMDGDRNAMYFKINGIVLSYILYDPSLKRKRIRIWIDEYSKVTLINTKHLTHFPEEFNKADTYIDPDTGTFF
jgi:hypothetical protein